MELRTVFFRPEHGVKRLFYFTKMSWSLPR
nr:MAG TPA: hypothetical protein [Caudoviricetes sp.]